MTTPDRDPERAGTGVGVDGGSGPETGECSCGGRVELQSDDRGRTVGSCTDCGVVYYGGASGGSVEE